MTIIKLNFTQHGNIVFENETQFSILCMCIRLESGSKIKY